MGLLSSKTLIRAHALFLFILAVYLTRSPEVITDSDVVYMIGEAMRIDISPTFSRPQSPFALCGVLLVADALVDLIFVTKVPQINELLARADAAAAVASASASASISSRSSNNNNNNGNGVVVPGETGATTAAVVRANPFTARIAALYSEIWTLLAASRFCLFFAVSLFIYQSKPGAWGVRTEGSSGLDQLKNRVVFTYGFMEMTFWLWILITLREERQETAARLAAASAQEVS
ncbi:increased loss of mitochondrial DNA protein 1 [Thermoascus aurantiacus ATCC 26904]